MTVHFLTAPLPPPQETHLPQSQHFWVFRWLRTRIKMLPNSRGSAYSLPVWHWCESHTAQKPHFEGWVWYSWSSRKHHWQCGVHVKIEVLRVGNSRCVLMYDIFNAQHIVSPGAPVARFSQILISWPNLLRARVSKVQNTQLIMI